MSAFLRLVAVLILITMALVGYVQLSCPSWPSVNGQIIQGGWASENRHQATVQYGLYEVRYGYIVGTQDYEGNRVSFDAKQSVVPIQSENPVTERQPREGDVVKVYYFPQFPSIAVLFPVPSPRLWIWGIMSVLFAVGLFAWARIWTHPLY